MYMGPLVPEIIGNELNLIIAFLIGIAFGFVLEQAGFSTSKKLVGLFYGYDFTVLRVFFTAGVTAMLGVILLGHYGLLDLSLIYINPTFLYSALAGGVIMGLGFVIGGFCPGTSLCAAAIGKIDAMIFIAGSFIGVLAFAEGYPLFEALYKAQNWGSPRIFDLLGISQGLFAFLLTAAAVIAFYATTLIENKVNGRKGSNMGPIRLYHAIALLAVLMGLAAVFMPEKRTSMLNEAKAAGFVDEYRPRYMTADELAFRLMDHDKKIQLFDFRKKSDYALLTLPGAQNISLPKLFEKEISGLMHKKDMVRIFFCYKEKEAIKAAKLAERLGITGIYVLQGGFGKFRSEILDYQQPAQLNTRQDADLAWFRAKAKAEIPVLIKESKSGQTEKKQAKRVIGGC